MKAEQGEATRGRRSFFAMTFARLRPGFATPVDMVQGNTCYSSDSRDESSRRLPIQ